MVSLDSTVAQLLCKVMQLEIRSMCMSIAFNYFCVTIDVHANCPRSLAGWTTSEVFQCSYALFPSDPSAVLFELLSKFLFPLCQMWLLICL